VDDCFPDDGYDRKKTKQPSGGKVGYAARMIIISERPHIPAESALWIVDKKITLFATDLIGCPVRAVALVL
jgi:hypothetical protein